MVLGSAGCLEHLSCPIRQLHSKCHGHVTEPDKSLTILRTLRRTGNLFWIFPSATAVREDKTFENNNTKKPHSHSRVSFPFITSKPHTTESHTTTPRPGVVLHVIPALTLQNTEQSQVTNNQAFLSSIPFPPSLAHW